MERIRTMLQMVGTVTLICGVFCPLFSQKYEPEAINKLIAMYKQDVRGPYKDIRWFCPDGSVLPPQERCSNPGGVQRARYKDEVVALSKVNHIYLGQILSTTPNPDFWDEINYNSRLKQYQLERYLQSVDNGWILQKGQYYRGAIQAEDEETWGINFFKWLLSKDEYIEKYYFLIRQGAMDIPHRGDDNRTLKVRAISKAISDEYPLFMNLRVKIHGQPQSSDLQNVKAFLDDHRPKLNALLRQKFEELISEMEIIYSEVHLESVKSNLGKLPKSSDIFFSLNEIFDTSFESGSSELVASILAEKIWETRQALIEIPTSSGRLALLDISLFLEQVFFRRAAEWEPQTLRELLKKIYCQGLVAAGTGFIEIWEWDRISADLDSLDEDGFEVDDLTFFLERSRSLVEWSIGMVRAVYDDVVELYGKFEPLAQGFTDDRIRASVLLSMGQSVGQLGDYIARETDLTNHILSMPNQSHARGLNPGYALGELVVVSERNDEIKVEDDKIYIFLQPPSDLKPVGGIATVTEGNLVSHVQLLARNLGIPNAVISRQNMDYLSTYNGKRIFYAVSQKGNVIMKTENDITPEEKRLFTGASKISERIHVPTVKIALDVDSILDLRSVDVGSSGRTCGPKAANLGQLKKMFPDKVVEGMVIPFGIFKKHMDESMPGKEETYWSFLQNVFAVADSMKSGSVKNDIIEQFIMSELGILREAISKMDLLLDFESDLRIGFYRLFNKNMGEVPVFLRSDTNMEDLKEFTGAGLNLTLFNVLSEEKIMQGIKDVWASPYTERSFKWRQRFLHNPENVFPSILIIPSVNVDCSGVMITKGVPTGNPDDLTIAFNRGAGGAVEGQAAESYLLSADGKDLLLSPSRESHYRVLPESGGSRSVSAAFNTPIMSPENLNDLRDLADRINSLFPNADEGEKVEPHDVELGFKDNSIWLFQVRPFVENKNAAKSVYLESITPQTVNRRIDLSKKL